MSDPYYVRQNQLGNAFDLATMLRNECQDAVIKQPERTIAILEQALKAIREINHPEGNNRHVQP